MKKRVIFVDMLNIFFRAYAADPSLSSDGQPIGGVKGSLKSLQKMCHDIKPNEVVLCWDGKGGSRKRKKIHEGYKEGRKPVKLNRYVDHLTDDETLQNKVWQGVRIIEYLNLFPVIQLKFDGVEADDIIAHLTRHSYYEDWEKVVVSSDKDFYQLCNESTVVYRPLTRKDKDGKLLPNEIVTIKTLVNDYNIHPNNFAIARAMAGDKSDNLEGVGGVGLKTAAKRFPMLKESERVMIEDVLDHAKNMIEGKKKIIKAYQSVAENEEILDRNYKMMQLYIPSIGSAPKEHIDLVLNEVELGFNKTKATQMMIIDGFGSLNLNRLFAYFNGIVQDQDR